MNAFESQKPGGAGDGEKRVRCMYCGANNFPSSPTCWQCGRPLQSLRPSEPAASGPPLGYPAPTQAGQVASRPVLSSRSESALAAKAAATLGLMFPYIGLPVGIVFLMLDDPRKTQLGWITIGWSVAGTVANGLLLIPLLSPLLTFFRGIQSQAGHGGLSGLPGLHNLPSPSGDPENINILLSGHWISNILSILQAARH
jgi:hypothetical protein